MNLPPVKKAKRQAAGDNRAVPVEQEQVLLALIEHHNKEVERNKWRVNHYTAELENSKRALEETKNQLSRLRKLHNILPSGEKVEVGMVKEKVEEEPTSPYGISQSRAILQPLQDNFKSSTKSEVDVKGSSNSTLLQNGEGSSQNNTKPKTQIVIPAANSVIPQLSKSHMGTEASNSSNLVRTQATSTKKSSVKSLKISYEQESADMQSDGTKRKSEQKKHTDLIRLIGGSFTARSIHCQTGCIMPSQHKRKLRSLVLCPTNHHLFATSALDGVVNLWQLQARGSNANCLSSTDCLSLEQRRWPEDITWHPHGNSLFSVYSADDGDSQVAVLNLNKKKEKCRVNFLEDKPHVKGIINNIMFMPWEDSYFVTGGSDHAVIMWTENDGINNWKPKVLHRNLHSSAVMGVAGLQHKQVIVSAGADKKIIGFDVLAGRSNYRNLMESKCMSVVPNPCDFNLFMVQTGTIGEQLRLLDYRVGQMEVHAFGWEQESSESHSALISQAWSPDGLYITSGSVDPVIHIFDIRYNSKKPTQSIRSHQKRVFKAEWHSTFPLLISISSDSNIGLHKIK